MFSEFKDSQGNGTLTVHGDIQQVNSNSTKLAFNLT